MAASRDTKGLKLIIACPDRFQEFIVWMGALYTLWCDHFYVQFPVL
jgi:hypothetical protein